MERTRPHASVTRARRAAVAFVAVILIMTACARSARGPPVSIDIALERARQALCTAGGIESPRALVATFEPEPPCMQASAPARVRCYLARPDTVVQLKSVTGGFLVRVVIPQLSDHVHEVSVRARADGALAISVDSAN
jgi:hypothetical protein